LRASPTRVYKVRNAAKVRITIGMEVTTDAVISPIKVEVPISDRLAYELMIAIEKPGESLLS